MLTFTEVCFHDMDATRAVITREAGFAISYYAPSYAHRYLAHITATATTMLWVPVSFPLILSLCWVWGYSKGLTVPTSQTLFAFQASSTVRAKGSAMKP